MIKMMLGYTSQGKKSKYLWTPFLLMVGFSFLLLACYREPRFPTAKLSEVQMIAILADIHLAEAKIADLGTWPATTRDSIAAVYYESIFKIHKVSAADYDQSMNAYMRNPDALAKIYEKVLEKLQKDQTKK